MSRHAHSVHQSAGNIVFIIYSTTVKKETSHFIVNAFFEVLQFYVRPWNLIIQFVNINCFTLSFEKKNDT